MGALTLILGATTPSSAGGIAIVGGSPRAIGRAGASAASDDGGGALLVNPAAMARRDGTRFQLGVGFFDDAVEWDPDHIDGPIARDQAGSSTLPLAAIVGSVGAWVIGFGAMTAGVSQSALRDPRDLPANELEAAFEYRYSGIAGSIRRDTLTLGVARRLGDSLAIGISVGASRLQMSETR
ncbi:MAG: outer membrane protein transport protein, partial [Deltaproteobacteria bacterium]|nr:outer membrane protein transport protein [Deltaproteobacteria bacterium]